MMYKSTSKKQKYSVKSKKYLLLLALALAIIIGSGFAFYRVKHSHKQVTGGIPPATKQEKKEVDQHKQQLAQSSTTPTATPTTSKPGTTSDTTTPTPATPTTSSKKMVDVSISYAGPDTTAGSYVVNAFMHSISEASGSCTLTLTKAGSNTVTVTAASDFNGTYSYCTPLRTSGLASGSWTVTVNYSSATSTGVSNYTQTMDVN